MKTFFNILLLVLIIPACLFAQYTVNDKDLVETTYERQFNKEIIQKYLSSSKSADVNAALLSIAQSQDTLFIDQVIKLNFTKHYKYICFALGEIGPSKKSAEFLLSNLKMNAFGISANYDILSALGKIGGKKCYGQVVDLYFKNDLKYFPGISIALYNFSIRKIGIKEQSLEMLYNEIKNSKRNNKRFFDAAFCLNKIGVPRDKLFLITDELERILIKKDVETRDDKYLKSALPYLLGSLFKSKYFPYSPGLKENLLKSNDYNIKVETAKCLCYYNFSSSNELMEYLGMLNDDNSNVAIETASSLGNIILNSNVSSFMNGFLSKAITSGKYDSNITGELFLSYLRLFHPSFDEALKKFGKYIQKKYLYRACGFYLTNVAQMNYLTDQYTSSDVIDKGEILSSLTGFQKAYPADKHMKEVFENALSSENPSLISIAADGLTQDFITSNEKDLTKIIDIQIPKYSNNPDFFESIISLTELAGKINNKLFTKSLHILKNSDLFSVRKFAYLQLAIPLRELKKESSQFNKFWKLAFKYKGADIKTIEGTIRINFLPEFAPITVGNFCVLAEGKFFNGIIFHRVVPGFVIQAGDPTKTGWGGPGYDIVSEFSTAEFTKGAVGMASAGKDTEGSQWFITTGDYPHLNGKYTLFASVISGKTTTDRIKQDDEIIEIKLLK